MQIYPLDFFNLVKWKVAFDKKSDIIFTRNNWDYFRLFPDTSTVIEKMHK